MNRRLQALNMITQRKSRVCFNALVTIIVLLAILLLLRGRNKKSTHKNESVKGVIAVQRKLIAHEMENYLYPNGNFNISASRLEDFVPELGGQPMRTLIISTWRSGSTFLGDIVSSHPGTYYSYEPLLDFGVIKILGPPLSERALKVIRDLFRCNYTELGSHLEFGQHHNWMFMYNRRLWFQCVQHPDLCFQPEFLNPFCKLFPFQAIKLTRLRLSIVQELLEDASLNLRVVLLVRDPRGTLQSRMHEKWCLKAPDCQKPQALCSDLVADYFSATNLTRNMPKTFTVIRYEDLALSTEVVTRKLFQFLGLQFHPKVKEFLETHTQIDVGGPESTFRNSQHTAFHWTKDLPHSAVVKIQEQCEKAMDLWGYIKADNSSHQEKLYPITTYRV